MLENIKFWKLNSYIHSYYVKGLHDLLLPNKDSLIKDFHQYKSTLTPNQPYNYRPTSEEFNNYFVNIFYNILEKYYIIGDNYEPLNSIGIYYQDNKNSNNEFHHHKFLSDIVGVTYIDPPNEGGDIEFLLQEKNIYKLSPQKDYIYFFPSWLMHRPTLQKSSIPRLCLNWSYRGDSKIINKITGDIW